MIYERETSQLQYQSEIVYGLLLISCHNNSIFSSVSSKMGYQIENHRWHLSFQEKGLANHVTVEYDGD